MTPTFVSGWLLTVAFVVLATVGIVLLGATMMARLQRHRRTDTAIRRMAPMRPLLLEVATGEDAGGEAAGQLVKVDRKDRRLVESSALQMLAKVKGQPALDLAAVLQRLGMSTRLAKGLHSLSSVRRAQAAWEIGLLRETARVDALALLLDDRSAHVRLAALRALSRIGDPSPAARMIAAAGDRGRKSGVADLAVVEAVSALGPAAGEAVGEALVAEDPQVRLVAARIVGNAQLSSLATRIQQMLGSEDNADVVAAQLWAIGQLGRGSQVHTIAPYTAVGFVPSVRTSAVMALEAIGHPDAVKTLSPLLADQDRRLASRAAEALAALGQAGLAALRSAHDDGGTAAAAAAGPLAVLALRSAPGGELSRD